MEGENNGFNIRPITDTTWLKIYNNHAIRMYHDKELRNFPYAFNQDYHNVANLQNGELLYCMDDGFVLDKVQPSKYDLHKMIPSSTVTSSTMDKHVLLHPIQPSKFQTQLKISVLIFRF